MTLNPPQFVLAAAPLGGGRLRNFRDLGPNGIARVLENPPTLRWAGFDLRTMDSAKLTEDGRLEVRSGDHKVIEVHQSGLLLARVAADADFLGWGVEPEQFARVPKLNPVACVEVHAAFLRLFRELIGRLARPTAQVRIHQAMRNAQLGDKYLFLTPYYSGRGIVIDPERFYAHSDVIDADHTFATEDVLERTDVVTAHLLNSFADFFDMPFAKIPFVSHSDPEPAFQEEQLKAL